MRQQTRTAYARLQRRSSLLEAPRLVAMRQLAEQAKVDASRAEKDRRARNVRRDQIRREFAAAEDNRTRLPLATGPVMLGVRRARAAATRELCDAGEQAIEEARHWHIQAHTT